MAGLLLVGIWGCQDLAGTQPLPAGTANQDALHTPAAARAMYTSALGSFVYTTSNCDPNNACNSANANWGGYLTATLEGGLLSDELQVNTVGASRAQLVATNASADYPLDTRQLPQGSESGNSYGALQAVRGLANQAIGALSAYAPDSSALRGELYALEGYAEVLLADLYCSGVPLSTLDFGAGYTYKAGSTTLQVYQHAVTLFDQALALTTGNARLSNLARVGKGRALLAQGQYAAAATAVQEVPDDFTYQFLVDWTGGTGESFLTSANAGKIDFGATVADREGLNGLPYRSSGDPRTAVRQVGVSAFGVPLYFPSKYGNGSATTPLTVASGVEARLIEAEAALQRNDVSGMLAILNTLRTTGTLVTLPADTIADTLGVSGCTQSVTCGSAPGGDTPDFGQPPGGFPVPGGYSFVGSGNIHPVSPALSQYCYSYSWYQPCYGSDSTTVVLLYVRPAQQLWSPGTGGVAGLAPLSDPGSTAERVDTLFAERAAWLFLDGHRQGDLRRLVRQYNRLPGAVYPTGPYAVPSVIPTYGSDVNFPIPVQEQQINPLSHGCFGRGA